MKTKIEWCKYTWNPITGCEPVSDGCAHCYAERMVKRLAGRYGYDKNDPFKPTLHEDKLEPYYLLKQPWFGQRPRVRGSTVFVNSMGDFFHGSVEGVWKNSVIRAINQSPETYFVILTKRPQNIGIYEQAQIPHNLFIGVSVENERELNRIYELGKNWHGKKMISFEPLLDFISPIAVEEALKEVGIDWVVCGKETGPNARPYGHTSVIGLQGACENACVPFFWKGKENYAKQLPSYLDIQSK